MRAQLSPPAFARHNACIAGRRRTEDDERHGGMSFGDVQRDGFAQRFGLLLVPSPVLSPERAPRAGCGGLASDGSVCERI